MSFLQRAALAVNKPKPSTYYDVAGARSNPVIDKFCQELNALEIQCRTYAGSCEQPGLVLKGNLGERLFELWNSYEERVPVELIQDKILEFGNMLMSIREYGLALNQCYERYLLKWFSRCTMDSCHDAQTFQTSYFPTGFNCPAATNILRGLMGRSLCLFYQTCRSDPLLLSEASIQCCLKQLDLLLLLTEALLPHSEQCWLVYNGTVYLYTICRRFMSLGKSALVLDYLLWTSACMEHSLPLCTIKYLDWRSTLYTAVCQCYYQLNQSHIGEAYARRALARVDELSQLEKMSSCPGSLSEQFSFRTATIKMAIMIFKRSAVVTRRKPKDILRPRNRVDITVVAQNSWPRTTSEKLLAAMFDCSSAQALALIEVLSDPCRRTLHAAPPAPDSEPDLQDLYLEIFLTASTIIAGGGGSGKGCGVDRLSLPIDGMEGVVKERSLMELASHGLDGITLKAVVKLIKAAYCYQQWQFFDEMLPKTLCALQTVRDGRTVPDCMMLSLLQAYDQAVPRPPLTGAVAGGKGKQGKANREDKQKKGKGDKSPKQDEKKPKSRKGVNDAEEEPVSKEAPPPGVAQYAILAKLLKSIACGPLKPHELDVDMIVDASVMLWKKCKQMLQRYQTGTSQRSRYLEKIHNYIQWVEVLDSVHEVIGWCGLTNIDTTLGAEVALRLALAHESCSWLRSTHPPLLQRGTPNTTAPVTPLPDTSTPATPIPEDEMACRTRTVYSEALACIHMERAEEVLRQGLLNISGARELMAATAGAAAIVDITWAREINPDLCPIRAEDNVCFTQPIASSSKSTIDVLNDKPHPLEVGTNNNASPSNGRTVPAAGSQLKAEVKAKNLQEKDLSVLEAGVKADVNDIVDCEEEECKRLEEERIQREKDAEKARQTAAYLVGQARDLHTDMLYNYHRISIKLQRLRGCSAISVSTASDAQQTNKQRCAGCKVAKCSCSGAGQTAAGSAAAAAKHHGTVQNALCCIQQCLAVCGQDCELQKKFLDDARCMLQKAEAEEFKLYRANQMLENCVGMSSIPPPPILISRSDSNMVFRVPAFQPASCEKVVWYRLFGKPACGPNLKIRESDIHIQGTGQTKPALAAGGCYQQFTVCGLCPGERYIFALAAYGCDGKLIGGRVGESTKPIVANHPLSIIMGWSYLCQVAYEIHYDSLGVEAFEVLWRYCVLEPLTRSDEWMFRSNKDSNLSLVVYRLNQRIIYSSSTVFLRSALIGLFAGLECHIRSLQLFCDVVSECGPLKQSQLCRIQMCERGLVLTELAGVLNDSTVALQSSVVCYGLLAPLLHHKIPSQPVIQILKRCVAVLQEAPQALKVKNSNAFTAQSLGHMTACVVYHMTRMLRMWGEHDSAAILSKIGRDLIANSLKADQPKPDLAAAAADAAGNKKKKKGDAGGKPSPRKTKVDPAAGEGEVEIKELVALENYSETFSRQSSSNSSGSPVKTVKELTGAEDLSVLYAYIFSSSSAVPSYQQLKKFRVRNDPGDPRLLECFVLLMRRALAEGLCEELIQWSSETSAEPSSKKDKPGSGTKKKGEVNAAKSKGSATQGKVISSPPASMREVPDLLGSDSPSPECPAGVQTFPATDIPLTSGDWCDDEPSVTNLAQVAREGVSPAPSMTSLQRQTKAERLELARAVLKYHFMRLYTSQKARRITRRRLDAERPWKSQLYAVQASAYISKLIKTIGTENSAAFVYRYRKECLSWEWFTLNSSRILLYDSPAIGGRASSGAAAATSQPSPTSDETGGQKKDGGAETKKGKKEKKNSDKKQLHDTTKATGGKASSPEPEEPLPPEVPLAVEVAAMKLSDLCAAGETQVETGSKAKDAQNPQSKGKSKKQTVESGIVLSYEPKTAIKLTFVHFKKAIVLAHRGSEWTLLQNVCKEMWNSVQLVMTLVGALDRDRKDFLSLCDARSLMCDTVHTAADCLLDMLQRTQQHQSTVTSAAMAVLNSGGLGARLRFEPGYDDSTSVDFWTIRRVSLFAMDLLHCCCRWESLVDVGLRLRVISRYSLSDIIDPMILVAQQRLIDRLRITGGPPSLQPAYQDAVACNCGRPITAEDYLNLQLYVRFLPKPYLPAISGSTGASDKTDAKAPPNKKKPDPALKPENSAQGEELEDKNGRALQLCSVPLDTQVTCQRISLSAVHRGRAVTSLAHCRTLLVVYLSKQAIDLDDIGERAACSEEEAEEGERGAYTLRDSFLTAGGGCNLLSREELQQIECCDASTVISAYVETIELLETGNDKELMIEAMHELGNVYWHLKNSNCAGKYWQWCLDELLQCPNAVVEWRNSLKKGEDIAQQLLARCGIWGCITAGVVASNIAQYLLTSDGALRLECCFLAAYSFKALFRASLPHPESDCDYATYEISPDSLIATLIPGVQLLSEMFRTDSRSLVGALSYICEQLVYRRHMLSVLPLLSLYEYTAQHLCRDVHSTVQCRLLRARALTDLSLYSQALSTLRALMCAERLPQQYSDLCRPSSTAAGPAPWPQFKDSCGLFHETNLEVLECMLEQKLDAGAVSLYGPHLTCQIYHQQAHLILSLASQIHALPNQQPHTQAADVKAAEMDNKKKNQSKASGVAGHLRHLASKGEDRESEEELKRALLDKAEEILSTLVESILTAEPKGPTYLSASEVELVVNAKLEQSLISNERHHSALAAQTVQSAMTILQQAVILSPSMANFTVRSVLSGLTSETLEGKCQDKCESPGSAPPTHNEPASITDQSKASVKVETAASKKPDAKRKENDKAADKNAKEAEAKVKPDKKSPPKSPDEKGAKKKGKDKSVESNAAPQVEGDNAEQMICQQSKPARMSKMERREVMRRLKYQEENSRSRARLNEQMWMRCRLALLNSLILEIRGVGQILGVSQQVKAELVDVNQCCTVGLQEAEAAVDIEMQAEFLMGGVMLQLANGKPADVMLAVLYEVERMLADLPELSLSASRLRITARMFAADLENLKGCGSTADKYTAIQQAILHQLQELGETVEERSDCIKLHSGVSAPLHNVYLPSLPQLVEVKLRVALSLFPSATAATGSLSPSLAQQEWLSVVSILSSALDMSDVIVFKNQSTRADLFLALGKAQKQLLQLGSVYVSYKQVIRTLLQSILTTYTFNHDLRLIKEAYQELSLTYIHLLDRLRYEEQCLASQQKPSRETEKKSSSESRQSNSDANQKRRNSVEENIGKADKLEKMKRQVEEWAWLTVRCAVSAGRAERSRSLLMVDNDDSLLLIGGEAAEKMPHFLSLDLVASKVLGKPLSDSCTDDGKEKEEQGVNQVTSTPPSSAITPPQQLYGDKLKLTNKTMENIKWLYVFRYENIVRRLFDLSYINTASCSSAAAAGSCAERCGSTAAATRVSSCLLLSPITSLRLASLHRYLSNSFSSYSQTCSAIFLPQQLADSLETEIFSNGTTLPSHDDNQEFPLHKYSANMISTLTPSARNKSFTARLLKFGKEFEGFGMKELLEPEVADACISWHGSKMIWSRDREEVCMLAALAVKTDSRRVAVRLLDKGLLSTLNNCLDQLTEHIMDLDMISADAVGRASRLSRTARTSVTSDQGESRATSAVKSRASGGTESRDTAAVKSRASGGTESRDTAAVKSRGSGAESSPARAGEGSKITEEADHQSGGLRTVSEQPARDENQLMTWEGCLNSLAAMLYVPQQQKPADTSTVAPPSDKSLPLSGRTSEGDRDSEKESGKKVDEEKEKEEINKAVRESKGVTKKSSSSLSDNRKPSTSSVTRVAPQNPSMTMGTVEAVKQMISRKSAAGHVTDEPLVTWLADLLQ